MVMKDLCLWLQWGHGSLCIGCLKSSKGSVYAQTYNCFKNEVDGAWKLQIKPSVHNPDLKR